MRLRMSTNGVLDFPTQAVVEREPRRDAPFVLGIRRELDVAQPAVHVAAALEEHHGEAEEKAGEGIAGGKWREDEEAVRGNALRHVDLVAAEVAAQFEAVRAARCARANRETSKVFCAVSRGPVIGSPTLAYPLTMKNGGPWAAASVLS